MPTVRQGTVLSARNAKESGPGAPEEFKCHRGENDLCTDHFHAVPSCPSGGRADGRWYMQVLSRYKERPEGEPAFSEAEGGREQNGKLLEHLVAILPFSAAPLSTGEAASCFCLV